jgi:uncharacterized protein (TIGR02145 family)
MKNTILVVFAALCCTIAANAQNDTMYVMKNDIVVHTVILNKSNTDSIVFYNPHKNTVLDIDGNRYKTVVIGSQTWMAEDLKVTHYRNGDPIPNLQDSTLWVDTWDGAYCAFNNSAENLKTYGALYNWLAVNDSRHIAPKGWHVASNAEMNSLITLLGGEAIAGDKMKEAGNTHWIFDPFSAATNSSGFTALPSGYRVMGYIKTTDANFFSFGRSVNYWTADVDTEVTGDYGYSYELNNNTKSFKQYHREQKNGFSVRCVKD